MSGTIIFVHGAFADSASWNGVVERLGSSGHRLIAFANPLRGIASDAAPLTDLVRTIEGPITLVGHSYGGAVISAVPADAGEIVSLVYVAAFALQRGESAGDASSLVPGSTLGETLSPVPLRSGGNDMYIVRAKYRAQFCADVPEPDAALMAVTQRPVTDAALAEPLGTEPLWRSVPSRFVFGSLDRNIPVGAHRIMAERAGSLETVEVEGASHVVGVSHPARVAEMVLAAAAR